MSQIQPLVQPHITIAAPKVDWGQIISGIMTGVQLFGPLIIQLIEATESTVTVHDTGVIQKN
jgi:hypothetical protein